MYELLIAFAAVVIFLSPCIVAGRCANGRRFHSRRRDGKPYEGVDRRAPH